MTAGQAVDRADGLRPNSYARSLKLGWLQKALFDRYKINCEGSV